MSDRMDTDSDSDGFAPVFVRGDTETHPVISRVAYINNPSFEFSPPDGYICNKCRGVHAIAIGWSAITLVELERSRSGCRFCDFVYRAVEHHSDSPLGNVVASLQGSPDQENVGVRITSEEGNLNIAYSTASGTDRPPELDLWVYTNAASKPTGAETKTNNIGAMLLGIRLGDMPKTFRDAVEICIKLKIKYLWIDSLCIIQNDLDDWRVEAAKMGQYYRNSYVTVAAHPTHDWDGKIQAHIDGGCHLSRKRPFEATVRGRDGQACNIFARQLHNHGQFVKTTQDGRCSEYFKRGWCFQERMLAPRIMHFTKSEVLFECNTTLSCECGGASRGEIERAESLKKPFAVSLRSVGQPTISPDASKEVLHAYRRLTEDYCEKRLTKWTDLLPALSSMASILQPALGSYYAGLWEADLYLGLQWSSSWGLGPCSELCDKSHREKDCPKRCYRHDEASKESFGHLTGGSLTLFTCAITMTGPLELTLGGWAKISGDKISSCTFILDAKQDEALARTKPVVCIELMRSRAIYRETIQPRRFVNPHYPFGEANFDADYWNEQPRPGRQMVSIAAIVAVDLEDGTFQRIGFTHYLEPPFLLDRIAIPEANRGSNAIHHGTEGSNSTPEASVKFECSAPGSFGSGAGNTH
ncbi:hypothetical protein SAPIO_CDS8300 [Scedosporium apiospermum]|uniref:Heterokaryon incompatibility domain-containing protein n=1 Tax=Pseudallescheria apiosperma TaxID=563466 RepID=A0A084FZB4_PSEDA|nr:uncharacterized protein SAPIO_CDS8300 [Scedosporium apiospermum]KEZ40426.1 hypothetical protein SAPIO_CDS8300 [Scedosporium apiospermum]